MNCKNQCLSVLCSQVLRNMFPHTAHVFVYADSIWMDRKLVTKRSLTWFSKSSFCDCFKASKILFYNCFIQDTCSFFLFWIVSLLLGPLD